MTAVAGLRGSGDWATDERPTNFRETILWRNPNGSSPITALMAKTASESTDDPKFTIWDEPMDIYRLQTSAAHSTTAVEIVVDSSDPSAASPHLRYGLAKHLVPGDVLQWEKVEDSDGVYDNELVRVVSVADDTHITLSRGFAGTTATSHADDTYLTKLSSAFAEGSIAARPVSRNPLGFYNYCQIFKTAFELTGTAEQTRLRTGDPLKNDRKRKMFDHGQSIEWAFMMGVRSETANSADNNKPLRTTGGLRQLISTQNITIFGTTPTEVTLMNAIAPCFDFDTDAGDERIFICGNGALNTFNFVAQHATGIRMEMGPVIKQYGMNLRTFYTPQGTLYLRTHPLLNRHPRYTYSGFILDFSALKWRYLRGRDTSEDKGPGGKGIQLPGEDTHKGQWVTEAGLELRHGGLTCGYLANLTYP